MSLPTKVLPALVCTLLFGCKTTTIQPPAPRLADAEQQRMLAMQAYEKGDYHLAMGILQAIDNNQADRQASCYIGAIHFRLHEYQAAEQKFNKCRLLNPEDPAAWLNSAATHIRLATEILLSGRSHLSEQSPALLHGQYDELLQALMRLQNIHREVILNE